MKKKNFILDENITLSTTQVNYVKYTYSLPTFRKIFNIYLVLY